jgi:hypothetical protein
VKVVRFTDMAPNHRDADTDRLVEWYSEAVKEMKRYPGEWVELHNDPNIHAYRGPGKVAFNAMQNYHSPFLFEMRYPAIGHGVVYGRTRRGPRFLWNRLKEAFKK